MDGFINLEIFFLYVTEGSKDPTCFLTSSYIANNYLKIFNYFFCIKFSCNSNEIFTRDQKKVPQINNRTLIELERNFD